MPVDPKLNEVGNLWYEACVDLAWSYPRGSFGHCFWWSARFEMDDGGKHWVNNPEQAAQAWLDYFLYKWEDR